MEYARLMKTGSKSFIDFSGEGGVTVSNLSLACTRKPSEVVFERFDESIREVLTPDVLKTYKAYRLYVRKEENNGTIHESDCTLDELLDKLNRAKEERAVIAKVQAIINKALATLPKWEDKINTKSTKGKGKGKGEANANAKGASALLALAKESKKNEAKGNKKNEANANEANASEAKE